MYKQGFTLILGLLLSSIILAKESCDDFYRYASLSVWATAYRAKMTEALFDKQDNQPLLDFYWHISNPDPDFVSTFHAILNPPSNVLFSSTSRGERQFPIAIKLSSRDFGKTPNGRLVDSFLDAYNNEKALADHAIIKTVEEMLEAVAGDRQSFGYVSNGDVLNGGRVMGTLRVFNGTEAFSDSPALMPMEWLALYKNLRFKNLDIEKIRKETPLRKMFELGKFSIATVTPYGLHYAERVRTALEVFLLRNYLENVPPDSLFFANTWNPTLVRMYKQKYGMRIAEEISVPEEGITEYFLVTTAEEMANRLREAYGLPETKASLEWRRVTGLPNLDGNKFVKKPFRKSVFSDLFQAN